MEISPVRANAGTQASPWAPIRRNYCSGSIPFHVRLKDWRVSSPSEDLEVRLAAAVADETLGGLGGRDPSGLGDLASNAELAATDIPVVGVGPGTEHHGAARCHELTSRLTGHRSGGRPDLRESAIGVARSRLPSADLRVGNAAELSYADGSMDLVLQFTMFSSILHAALRAKVAREMSRVVRPGGLIVSYDFRINPLNPNTRGLARRELQALFPGHAIDARTVTLARPIARFVASRSYAVAAALQALVPLRTHLLAFITPPEPPGQPPRR